MNYQYIKKNLYCINKILFDTYLHDETFIQENSNIIDSAMNWTALLIKKELYTNFKKPILNRGLKLPKERQLFN